MIFRTVTTFLLGLTLIASAAASNFQEGTHYQVFANPGPVEEPGKVEVREFFSYVCPACASMEGPIHAWEERKADYIHFTRTPVLFLRNAEPLARAYYVQESLGLLDEMHQPIFDALHVHRENLFSPDALARFFAKYGVEKEQFNRLYSSFGVSTKVRQADALTRDYQIPGVPNFVVNGKYLVLRQNLSTSDELFAVIDYLAEKEHSGQ